MHKAATFKRKWREIKTGEEEIEEKRRINENKKKYVGERIYKFKGKEGSVRKKDLQIYS